MPQTATVPIDVAGIGYDPAMQVPLAGEPGYKHQNSGEGFIDERFAPLDNSGSGAGSAALKRFLEEQTAEQTPPSNVQVGQVTFRVYHKDGAWRAKGVSSDGRLHRFSASTRDEVLDKLVTFGKQEQCEAIRELTRSEEIEVARLAQSGHKFEALARYLELRIPPGSRFDRPEMAADPELQSVMSECAIFCWLNFRSDVRDSAEFRDFLADYAGSRPLTFDLLDAAWTAFLPYQEKQARQAAVRRFAETKETTANEVQQDLEDADDETIRRTYWATAKHLARAGR